MHAAPAHEDCLELPSERVPDFDNQVDGLLANISLANVPVFLPPEIQFQIINHLFEAPTNTGCGFCSLFALSTACKVSRLWYHYVVKKLYSTIHLDISTPCEKHYQLSSKHVQMAKRIPQLVRTLESQPRLAGLVKRIQFPSGFVCGAPGALSYWVTCELEKKLLPALVRACGKLEAVEGLEDILSQLFNGEHYCYIDSNGGEEHGYLAQALFEKKTMREWTWGRGFIRKLGDRVSGGFQTFTDCHKNWSNLECLSIIGLSGMTPPLIIGACEQLPALKRLVVGFGNTILGEDSRNQFTSTLLNYLPERLEKITFVDKTTSLSMETILDWVDSIISTKISEGLLHYGCIGEIRDTLTEQSSNLCSSGMEVYFETDVVSYDNFWEVYSRRPHSRYSRAQVDSSATIMRINICF